MERSHHIQKTPRGGNAFRSNVGVDIEKAIEKAAWEKWWKADLIYAKPYGLARRWTTNCRSGITKEICDHQIFPV